MANWLYLLLNILVVSGPLVGHFLRPSLAHIAIRPLLKTYLLVSAPFIVWDIWATSRGHWSFNPDYVLGPKLFGLPFEEILFFFCIPFAMLWIWRVMQRATQDTTVKHPRIIYLFSYGIAASILGLGWSQEYTLTVGASMFVTLLLLQRHSNLLTNKLFWRYQLVHGALFLFTNSILTALPIVLYGETHQLGHRIGTIPIEDFVYSFSLISLMIFVYDRADPARIRRP